MKQVESIISALALSVILSGGLAAQNANGKISGTVVDAAGGVLNEAVVSAAFADEVSKGNSKIFEAVTDTYGEFTIRDLPAGSYRVVAGMKGSEYTSEERLVIGEGEEVSLRLILGEGAAACSSLSEAEKRNRIADADKLEIVQLVLDATYRVYARGKSDKDLKSRLPLVSDNLQLKWLGVNLHARFELHRMDGIRDIADTRGNTAFVALRDVEFGPGCATVKADISWVAPRGSGVVILDGDFRTYELRKFGGGWQLRLVDWKIG